MHDHIIVIVGPTASGKTAFSIEVAKAIDGEIISADSRQVYRGLDIGTGKVTIEEMQGVPHHLLDVADPHTTFTANDFVRLGRIAIQDIQSRGKVPIIVGGTGFYIDALLDKVPLADVGINHTLRSSLKNVPVDELYERLSRIDPDRAAAMNTPSERNNHVRLIRAIEVATASHPVTRSDLVVTLPKHIVWIGIRVRDEELRERINVRLSDRLNSGMIEESQSLHAHDLSYERMESLGLEYRYLARFLTGTITRDQLESQLRIAIRQYAKRQMTYWKRNDEIEWYARQELPSALRDITRRVLHDAEYDANQSS